MITKNESKVLRMLLMAFGEDYSINNIAKKCDLSPNGTIKILRKFESLDVLKSKKVANINSYKIDFSNNKTKSILELVLIPEISGKLKYRADDLIPLEKITEIGIIFGSYISNKEKPKDIDLFFVLNKKNFNEYKKISKRIYPTMPLKVQDVLQTEEDLKKNISKKDKVIIEILKTGIILWGHDKLIKIIKNAKK